MRDNFVILVAVVRGVRGRRRHGTLAGTGAERGFIIRLRGCLARGAAGVDGVVVDALGDEDLGGLVCMAVEGGEAYRTRSATQKYMARAVTVGTRPAQSEPARLVTSPMNQMARNMREMPSAEPDL